MYGLYPEHPAHHIIAFPGKPAVDLPNSAFNEIPRNRCDLIESDHRCPFEAGAGKSRMIGSDKEIGIRGIFRDMGRDECHDNILGAFMDDKSGP